MGNWLVRSRPPPNIHDPPVYTGRPAATHIMDGCRCQLPLNDDPLYSNPEYSYDEYIQA